MFTQLKILVLTFIQNHITELAFLGIGNASQSWAFPLVNVDRFTIAERLKNHGVTDVFHEQDVLW